jgi:arylsulfatase A
MDRRKFACLLAGSTLGLSGPTIRQAARPNIVIIFADDLGWGDLGCYGHPTIRTPNLDRMAQEGMRFTQFYSAAPVCTPSRAALMTGRLPIRSGLTRVLSPRSTGGIQNDEVTLAEALKSAGYATACIGKWHLGHRKEFLPLQHGFDRYFGVPYSNDMSPATNARPDFKDLPATPLIRGDETIEQEPQQARLTKRYTEEAAQFIYDAVRDRKPFFLYMPHTFPHTPLAASEDFRGKSARGLYGDVVEELDWSAGQILRALRDLKADQNTLVLFSSDNGPWLTQRENGGSAGLLREGKTTTWEGGMREPFLARWPGRIAPGTITSAFGTLMDVFPTCLRLAGVPIPSGRIYDGEDLSPVLFRNEPGREALLFYYRGEELRAVRKGPWKLHVATSDSFPVATTAVRHDPPLLFNLHVDPSEKYDVADANPGVVKNLLDVLEQHRSALKPGPAQH